jgi:hypothetical protein
MRARMTWIGIGAFILMVTLLSACATSPMETDLASTVPADRILNILYSVQKPGTGEVVVKQDHFSGPIQPCSVRLYVDGVPLADMKGTEKFIMYLPEGDHILSAEPGILCLGGLKKISVSVKQDKSSVFRMGWGTIGEGFVFVPTAF